MNEARAASRDSASVARRIEDPQRRSQHLATLLADAKGGPHDRLRRGGAEENEHARADHLDLGLQPGPAGADLARVRLLVQAPPAATRPPEVLDRVGDVDPRAVDARLVQGLLEQAPGRADERLALEVLLVARLLADQHQLRALAALPEDSLGGVLPQFAAPAGGGRLLELLDAARPLGRLGGHAYRTYESGAARE